ncbi:hypothetical protein QBE53_03710 [Vallitaleaceae bacterium 9-2]
MRKVLPILILVLVIGGIVYYYGLQGRENQDNESSGILTDERILELSQSTTELANFISSVKETPEQVVRTNSIIRKMTYSGEYNEAEVESLVNMQRMLFQEELLEHNPKEFHHIMIRSELEQWEKAELKIIGSEYLPAKYQSDDTAIVKVIFYTNDPNRDIYAQYVLVKNALDQWEIKGWMGAEPFEIVK